MSSPKKQAAPKPPRKGAGRPKKPQAPQGSEQVRLAQKITEAETRRDLSDAEYAQNKTVAAELAKHQGYMEVASAWSAYLRATGNHTHALKWADAYTKLAARVAALRELAAVDLLQEIAERDREEHEVLGRVRGLP